MDSNAMLPYWKQFFTLGIDKGSYRHSPFVLPKPATMLINVHNSDILPPGSRSEGFVTLTIGDPSAYINHVNIKYKKYLVAIFKIYIY